MDEICTCGARLVEGAVFCHKCGKPLREIATETEPESTAPIAAVVPQPAPPPPVSFRNRAAVQSAFWVAALALLLSMLHPLLTLIVWVAAGFAAVYLYRRRTGVMLNVRGGMIMGWITGVILFAFIMVTLTVEMVTASGDGGLGAQFRQQIQQQIQRSPNPAMTEYLRTLDSPQGMATMLLLSMFFVFVLITLFSVVGGALGAKFSGRDGTRPAA
jgi:hypothetical protein